MMLRMLNNMVYKPTRMMAVPMELNRVRMLHSNSVWWTYI